MKNFGFTFLGALSLLFASCFSGETDETRIAELVTNGTKIERDRVVAWFPTDSLSSDAMNALVDTLNMGIRAAEKVIGKRDWRLYQEKPINYYFSTGGFRVAYASRDGDVFIPFFRVRTNKNPWLHETLHILLRSNKGNWNQAFKLNTYFNMPQWFTEGLPEYLAAKISYDSGFYKADFYNSGGFLTIDSACNTQLKGEKGSYILEHIGDDGILTELLGSDRAQYSPTFYNCSCSFTKYLVETYGLDDVLNAIGDYQNEQDVIEEKTGKSLETLKAEWLSTIK